MNAVGIDVSKGKSTVAIYQPGDQVILKPKKTNERTGDLIINIDTKWISPLL